MYFMDIVYVFYGNCLCISWTLSIYFMGIVSWALSMYSLDIVNVFHGHCLCISWTLSMNFMDIVYEIHGHCL